MIAVPVTAFVAVAPAAISIAATIIAIVATFSALFPIESTDIAIAVVAIPPSVGIAIVLGQDGASFDRVRCARRAAKREEGTGCKKNFFHFSVSSLRWHPNWDLDAKFPWARPQGFQRLAA
jgi:hypothetical protein